MGSLVNGADADKAYAAFLEFKDVVKKNQVSAPGPVATAAPAKYASIDAAAKSLFADCRCIGSAPWEAPWLDVCVRRGSSVVQVRHCVGCCIVVQDLLFVDKA